MYFFIIILFKYRAKKKRAAVQVYELHQNVSSIEISRDYQFFYKLMVKKIHHKNTNQEIQEKRKRKFKENCKKIITLKIFHKTANNWLKKELENRGEKK